MVHAVLRANVETGRVAVGPTNNAEPPAASNQAASTTLIVIDDTQGNMKPTQKNKKNNETELQIKTKRRNSEYRTCTP